MSFIMSKKTTRPRAKHPTSSAYVFYVGILVMLNACNVHAKIGYFWHITDLHLDTFYPTQGDVLKSCWHIEHHQTSSSGRTPGRFGDYLCDSPWSLLESSTLAMKSKQGDNVEFVLWTGDGLSHSSHRLLEHNRLEILRNITELLGRTFPSQFVFPVLGHEDGSNTNFRRLGELWRHWLPSEALQTFEKGGYYTIEQTKSRLRIIALNTNFMRHDPKYMQSQLAAIRQRQMNPASIDSTEYRNYYHHGSGHHYHTDPSGYGHSGAAHYGNGGQVSALSAYDNHEQWSWLEDVLAKSNRNKETVYIVGHIPPGSDERFFGSHQNGHTTFSEKNNLRYLELVRKYSSIIQGQFFGHLHSDSFRIIYNKMGTPVSWIMISPSVTPRKMSVGSNNPAMRLYKFDTDSGQVLDYTQYYLDLGAANKDGEANWLPEYNLTTHYFGLGEISANSLNNLAERFMNNDSPLFAKYFRANSVRYPTQPCEAACALHHYCAITRVDYNDFRQCLENAASALGSRSTGRILCPSCPIFLLIWSIIALNTSSKILIRLIYGFTAARKSRISIKNLVTNENSKNPQNQDDMETSSFARFISNKTNIFKCIDKRLTCILDTLCKIAFYNKISTHPVVNTITTLGQNNPVVNVVSDKLISRSTVHRAIFLMAISCGFVAFCNQMEISFNFLRW